MRRWRSADAPTARRRLRIVLILGSAAALFAQMWLAPAW
jgi:hypothetical protein